MNKLEKIVYDAVKSNARLKATIRNTYQSFFDLLPNKKDYSIYPIDVKEGFFYGFHDLTPFNSEDNLVLAHKLLIPFRMPNKEDGLEVGYFKFAEGKATNFVTIGTSYAWNYHKGCRLQWLGQNKVMYNDSDGDVLVSRIFDLNTKETKTISYPIDSTSKDGKYASTFNYGRLEKYMPGYGYAPYSEVDHFNEEKMPEQTGLFLGDLENGTKELLISLKELSETGEMTSEYENCHHYVTHSLFSPDGRYISCLHRWVDKDDTSNRHSRLFTYDLELKTCHISPTNDMVSHYVWNSKNQIIAYCRVGEVDCHVLFKEPTLQEYQKVAYPKLNSDGHQSFINEASFVTDTYPDKYRMANLYKVDVATNETTFLASLNSFKKYQSKLYKHWACDLHPRMNNKGDVVCFDSVHTKKRALCFMKIK
ncbi:hypothetical protein [uncultured Maribacter sp.]|uniref:hypothetical protein n=1 Tax=uncultured Maribacter sp. TaxID=431308 RepID=UPI002611D1CB|nr:hypothetical protein [uncultured Maribacter sp.]